jgi:DMSO/TMAO reductase YedYZ molybdopterin-dependent catalytic subunit
MADRFAGRTIHGIPPHARRTAENESIRIEGNVERMLTCSRSDLSNLEHRRFLDAIPPEGFGHWPQTDWSGVPISELIQLASPRPDSRWIQILGGPLATVIPIDAAERALLCDQLGDNPIPLESGGPFRLVAAHIPYNLCVKWVDRIVVSVEEPDRSVERVAEARQRARDAKGIS